MTHQRMPFLRHLKPLQVKAAITTTIVASSRPAAMQLMISRTLLVRKTEVGCKAQDQDEATLRQGHSNQGIQTTSRRCALTNPQRQRRCLQTQAGMVCQEACLHVHHVGIAYQDAPDHKQNNKACHGYHQTQDDQQSSDLELP